MPASLTATVRTNTGPYLVIGSLLPALQPVRVLQDDRVCAKTDCPPLDGRLPAKIQSLRVTETAHWLEWQDWADPILQQPYTIKDGHLHVPDVPGVGIEWNEDVVEAHRI